MLISFIILLTSKAYAQVTIGSANQSSQGALLDLKQQTDGSSYLGLGLPRVMLTNLTPTTDAELAKSIGSTTGSYDKREHIGLLIYNVNEDWCSATPIHPGMYVWNGSEWEKLSQDGIKASPEVKYYTDTRPHGGAMADAKYSKTYPYRKFGDAGEWMLENMRYIPAPQEPIQITPKDLGANTKDKAYRYPTSKEVVSDFDKVPDTWTEKQGLFYTYSAATMGAWDHNDDLNDFGHGSNVESQLPQIQGICPPGWHVPTDREWNELEAEIHNNAWKYSSFTAEEVAQWGTWKPAWNTQDGVRGNGHGNAMNSVCKVPENNPSSFIFGKSLPSALGGFDILLVGGSINVNENIQLNWGKNAEYWSTSTGIGGETAWHRRTTTGGDLRRFAVYQTNMQLVRCKR